jgi:hypothetical protein
MAAPNIFNPSNCTLARTSLTATTAAANLVTNAANSSTAVRLTSLYLCNYGTATANCTLDVHNGTSVLSNITYGLPIPVNATIEVISSASRLHLTEGESIRISANANSTIQATVSYEVLS